MKKNGFTLIEILGVLIILSLLMLLVFPKIINSVKSSGEKVDVLLMEMIEDATGLFIRDHQDDYEKKKQKVYCISLETLVNTNYLNSPVSFSNSETDLTTLKSVKVTYTTKYEYELVDNASCTDYTYFEDGDLVYFDVAEGVECKEAQYNLSYDSVTGDYLNSLTGYNGISKTSVLQNSCLKFYSFGDLDEGATKVNLLLDHNVTDATPWSSNETSTSGPSLEILLLLVEKTSSWQGTLTPSDYTLNQINGATTYANYTIDYDNINDASDYRARFITAEEVSDITFASSEPLNFLETTSPYTSWFYFDSATDTTENLRQTRKTNSIIKSKYAWLFDRTNNCITYGCNIESNDSNVGYWAATSVYGASINAWQVRNDSSFNYSDINEDSSYGIRPVIEVSKELF